MYECVFLVYSKPSKSLYAIASYVTVMLSKYKKREERENKLQKGRGIRRGDGGKHTTDSLEYKRSKWSLIIRRHTCERGRQL